MYKISIVALSLLIISSCTIGKKGEVTSEPINTNEAQTTRESTYEQDLKNASSKIKDSEEFKSCMDMNVPMCIQSAGMRLAQTNGSVEFCSELSTQEQKDSCVFAVTIVKLQETKNKNLCNDLSNTYKKECIKIAVQTLAIEKNDSSLCKELEQKTGSGNMMNIEDNAADYCIMNVVTSNANSSNGGCDSITSPQVRDMCNMNIRAREDISTSSPNIQN